MSGDTSKSWASDIGQRVLREEIERLEARLCAAEDSDRHEIRVIVLKEMVRARYDASHHTPDVIAKNVATANAYAEAFYPGAK